MPKNSHVGWLNRRFPSSGRRTWISRSSSNLWMEALTFLPYLNYQRSVDHAMTDLLFSCLTQPQTGKIYLSSFNQGGSPLPCSSGVVSQSCQRARVIVVGKQKRREFEWTEGLGPKCWVAGHGPQARKGASKGHAEHLPFQLSPTRLSLAMRSVVSKRWPTRKALFPKDFGKRRGQKLVR